MVNFNKSKQIPSDHHLPNGNGNGTNFVHNHDYEGLQHYDNSETANNFGMVDSLKLEAMEKNISLLNREVKKIKNLEDSERQLQVDLGMYIYVLLESNQCCCCTCTRSSR